MGRAPSKKTGDGTFSLTFLMMPVGGVRFKGEGIRSCGLREQLRSGDDKT